jgi:hypothetical protein
MCLDAPQSFPALGIPEADCSIKRCRKKVLTMKEQRTYIAIMSFLKGLKTRA